MVRFSVCIEMIFRERPFLDRIDAVANAGLSSFEFWRWRPKDINGILKRKEEHGLAVAAFCVDPMGRIVNLNTKEEFIKGVKDSIQVAYKLECSRLIVTTGNTIEGVPKETQHENIVESLKKAAKLVEKADVTLVLEPLNILVDHKGYFLYSSHEGFEILKQVESPNVKLLYDVYHQQITEGNLIDTISKNIGLIGHFHTGDVPGRHEPGTGEINYANVFKKIDELGYNGFVGLEFRPLTGSEEALEKVRKLAASTSSQNRRIEAIM